MGIMRAIWGDVLECGEVMTKTISLNSAVTHS